MAFTRSGVRSPSPPLSRSGSVQEQQTQSEDFKSQKVKWLLLLLSSEICDLPWLFSGGWAAKVLGRAGIAQLVEHNLAKVGVAGSSPVSRSTLRIRRGVEQSGSSPGS